jgi:signal transduction histidine kinase
MVYDGANKQPCALLSDARRLAIHGVVDRITGRMTVKGRCRADSSATGYRMRHLKSILDGVWLVPILIAASLAIAVFIDFFVWPTYNSAILYAVPLALGARYASLRVVIALGVIAVALDLVSLSVTQIPIGLWPFTLLALSLIAFFAVQLAKLQQRERRRAREAELAREQLREFMGLVVHDLRGLLTVAMGYSQLARRQLKAGKDGAILDALDKVDRAQRGMHRLVNDLLDATRIGAGRFVIHPTVVDLADLVRQVVAEQQPPTGDHRLVLDAPHHLAGVCDAERVRQVLMNLTANAIKYSPPGTEICVSLRPVNGKIVLSVTDHGRGIAPDKIDQLFQPFARLGREREATGTGLGCTSPKASSRHTAGGLGWKAGSGSGAPSRWSFRSVGRPTQPRKREWVDCRWC